MGRPQAPGEAPSLERAEAPARVTFPHPFPPATPVGAGLTLVGVGPGDPDLLSVAAVRALTALGGTTELGGLVDVLLKAAAGERGELEKAVVAICTTNRGHAESATAFLERFKAAGEPEREILLPTLGRIGGSAAPAVVE